MPAPYVYFLLLDFLLVVIGMILVKQGSINLVPVLLAQAAPRPLRKRYDRISLEIDGDIYKRVFDLKRQGYDLAHFGEKRVIMVKELD